MTKEEKIELLKSAEGDDLGEEVQRRLGREALIWLNG